MKVKRSDVHIQEQYFIITIKKGRVFKEVKRPIKNIALQYWEKAIESAHSGKSTQIDPLPPRETDPLRPFQIDPLIPAQIDPLKK